MNTLAVGSLPFGAFTLTRVAGDMYGVRVLRLGSGHHLGVDTLLSATLPSEGEARAYVRALEAGEPAIASDVE